MDDGRFLFLKLTASSMKLVLNGNILFKPSQFEGPGKGNNKTGRLTRKSEERTPVSTCSMSIRRDNGNSLRPGRDCLVIIEQAFIYRINSSKGQKTTKHLKGNYPCNQQTSSIL